MILMLGIATTMVLGVFFLLENGIKSSADIMLLLVVLTFSMKLLGDFNGKNNKE